MNVISFYLDGYNDRDVQYIWTHGLLKSIKMAADMRLSQFDLIGFPAGNSSFSDTRGANCVLSLSFLPFWTSRIRATPVRER